MSPTVLHREIFSEAEAARLLRVAQSTLHYWLEGGEQRGRRYEPIVRPEPRGTRTVTWAEFIEAGFVRQYRRSHQVPMVELRAFVERLRRDTGSPYPLAEHRPFVGEGRRMVREVQDEVGLEADFCLVAEAAGQLVLTPASEAFVGRVTWDADDVAAAWRPHDDPRSPVRMSPELRFGRPAVGGISTEALWEHVEAGEDEDEVARVFGLDRANLRWALAYENSARAA